MAAKGKQKHRTVADPFWLAPSNPCQQNVQQNPPSAQEQKVVELLKNDPQMHKAFIDRAAALCKQDVRVWHDPVRTVEAVGIGEFGAIFFLLLRILSGELKECRLSTPLPSNALSPWSRATEM